jgi:hypothetical protein
MASLKALARTTSQSTHPCQENAAGVATVRLSPPSARRWPRFFVKTDIRGYTGT